MNTTTGTERRSLRNNPSSTGWNAINHAPFTHSPQPTPEPRLRVESESPFYKTPEPPVYPPILPPARAPTITVSEGIKRTGTWLDDMAKRRKAAQATVRVSSESQETTPARLASTVSPQSSIVGGSNFTSPTQDKAQETRIVPAVKRRQSQYPTSSPTQPKSHHTRGVSPTHPCVQTSDSPSEDQCQAVASRSTQSPVSYVQSCQSTEKIEISESDASSVDSDEPDQEQGSEEDDEEEEDGEVFEVERILDERNVYGDVQFLLQWANYPEQSWISEDDCDCEELIRNFRALRARRLRLRRSRVSCSNIQQYGPDPGDQVDQRNLRAKRRATIDKVTQLGLPSTLR